VLEGQLAGSLIAGIEYPGRSEDSGAAGRVCSCCEPCQNCWGLEGASQGSAPVLFLSSRYWRTLISAVVLLSNECWGCSASSAQSQRLEKFLAGAGRWKAFPLAKLGRCCLQIHAMCRVSAPLGAGVPAGRSLGECSVWPGNALRSLLNHHPLAHSVPVGALALQPWG